MTLDVTIDDPEYLMKQARMTAWDYLIYGHDQIDERFGDGYSAKHPELLAAYMRTAAVDFHTGIMKTASQDLRDALISIRDTLETISQNLG